MISCKQASRLASEKQERSLTLKERISLRWHLLYCAGCRRMVKQFEFLSDATRGWMNRND